MTHHRQPTKKEQEGLILNKIENSGRIVQSLSD